MDDRRYRDYFEEMPCYLSVQDRNLRIIEANRRFRKDFGDPGGRYCYEVFRQTGGKCPDCPAELTFRDGQRHGLELRVKRLSGEEAAVIVYTTPIRSEAGEITAIMEMATDITEIKLLQERLRESRERYRNLFEEVPCYISIQDRDLRVVEANRRFREDFGEIQHRRCFEIYMHRSEPCVPCAVQQTFQDGQVHQGEEVVTTRKGEQKNVLVLAAPIHSADGKIRNVMEMATDITQIRELQSQLASLGMVISSISHGIKGLLTGLDGGMYLVNSGLQKNAPDRIRQGWKMVERNVSRIRTMVLDLLYYAKDREPNWEWTRAEAIAEEVYSVQKDKASEHGIQLIREIDPAAGEFQGDPKFIRSLLVNLFENAMDACRVDTKKKDHQIVLRVKGDPENVQFEICDNGIGMDRETREKAFSLFFSSKAGDGTGLGLFISNKIAQAHGGSISLQSEPDQGTCVTVTLPRRRPAKVENGSNVTP